MAMPTPYFILPANDYNAVLDNNKKVIEHNQQLRLEVSNISKRANLLEQKCFFNDTYIEQLKARIAELEIIQNVRKEILGGGPAGTTAEIPSPGSAGPSQEIPHPAIAGSSKQLVDDPNNGSRQECLQDDDAVFSNALENIFVKYEPVSEMENDYVSFIDKVIQSSQTPAELRRMKRNEGQRARYAQKKRDAAKLAENKI